MQCQKVLEEKAADPEPKPDEDGPPSSDGAEELRSTEDESMGSDADEPEKPHGAIYGGYFEQALGPRVVASAFRRIALRMGRVHPGSPYRRQREALCAIHALNNCLGGWFCTDQEMKGAPCIVML